jgi:hypothetical protein
VNVAAQLKSGEFRDIREFINEFHSGFADAVRAAQEQAGQHRAD